jgi:hypothetical protein
LHLLSSLQMFAAKANSKGVAYGWVLRAADEAGAETPAGWYFSGVLVETSVAKPGHSHGADAVHLRWAFARTNRVFYVTGADNTASPHLHAALDFQEIMRLASKRSPAGVGVLSRLVGTAAHLASAHLPATSDGLCSETWIVASSSQIIVTG